MPCCSGHTCDFCATCTLGVCCQEGGGQGLPGRAKPVRAPRRRPVEPAVAPRTRPAVPA